MVPPLKTLQCKNDLREHVAPRLREELKRGSADLLRCLRAGTIVAYHDRPKGSGAIRIPKDYWNKVRPSHFGEYIDNGIKPTNPRTFLYSKDSGALAAFVEALRNRDLQLLNKTHLARVPIRQASVTKRFDECARNQENCDEARTQLETAAACLASEYSKMRDVPIGEAGTTNPENWDGDTTLSKEQRRRLRSLQAAVDQCESQLLELEQQLEDSEESFWELVRQIVSRWPEYLEVVAGEFMAFVYGPRLNAVFRVLERGDLEGGPGPSASEDEGEMKVATGASQLQGSQQGPDKLDWVISHIKALSELLKPFRQKTTEEWYAVFVELMEIVGAEDVGAFDHYILPQLRDLIPSNKPFGQTKGKEQAARVQKWYFECVKSISDTADSVKSRIQQMPQYHSLPQPKRRAKPAAKVSA